MVLLVDHLTAVLLHMTLVMEDTARMKTVSSFQFQQVSNNWHENCFIKHIYKFLKEDL